MISAILDEAAFERAAEAIFNFDEDLTDKGLEETGIVLSERRKTWAELCQLEPEAAESYRGRARAALVAAIGTKQSVS